MIPSSSVARWLVVVGMSCLTMLGAAPRLVCPCPNRSCQLVCEQPLAHVFTAVDADCADPPACCCHHDRPADKPEHGQALRSTVCHCQMQLVGTKVSSPERAEARHCLQL